MAITSLLDNRGEAVEHKARELSRNVERDEREG